MAISRNDAFPPVTDSQGVQTNPSTSTIMADTGALAYGGLYEMRVLVGGSVSGSFNIQHRDASNASTIRTVLIRSAAGQTGEYIVKFDMKSGERLRAFPAAGITGDAEVTINAVRII